MSNEAPTDALRLVPCPFCGGDVINTRSQEMTEGPAYYWHKCETCGAESEGDYGEDVAVTAWNRRAAPASPLPGGGWQDISTAPKDGTVIDLWSSDQRYADCKWSEETPNGFGDASGGPGWVQQDCDVTGSWHWSLIGVQPTHWQPIPAAPTGDA